MRFSLKAMNIPQPTSINNRRKKVLFLLAALLAVVASAGSIYYLQVYAKSPYKFRYTTTSTYTLKSVPKGQAISFDQPTQFTERNKDDNQVENQHLVKVDGKDYFVGYVAAARSFLPNALSDNDIKSVASDLSNSSNPKYELTIANFQQFIKARLPDNWTAKFNDATKFSNQSINENAWSIDFSATGSSSSVKGTKLMKGKAVMALTSSYTYYFMAMSTFYNWQPNIAVWDKAFETLKLGF